MIFVLEFILKSSWIRDVGRLILYQDDKWRFFVEPLWVGAGNNYAVIYSLVSVEAGPVGVRACYLVHTQVCQRDPHNASTYSVKRHELPWYISPDDRQGRSEGVRLYVV